MVGTTCGAAAPWRSSSRFSWAAVLKGVSLLLVPPEQMAAAYKGLGFEWYFYAWMGAVLVLGLLITLAAFAT